MPGVGAPRESQLHVLPGDGVGNRGWAGEVTWPLGLPAEVFEQGLLATGPAWGRCQQRELRLFLVHKTLWSCWMGLFQASGPAGDSGWAGKSRVPPHCQSSCCPGQA